MAESNQGHGNIAEYIKGLTFPADKNKIMEHAKKSQGPDTQSVIQILRQIADKKYHSFTEVMNEVAKLD